MSVSPDRRVPTPGTVHVVAHSHLDVQWRWTVVDTVQEFLPKTVRQVAERADQVAGYVVSIDGVFRLQLLRDFHPELWEQARELIRRGVWHVAGPLWEATDCLVPSAEALIRQVAVGQRFLERELDLDPRCALLPDCFGFPASLPSILDHCGIRSFLTQKLVRGSLVRAAAGVPFPVGWWQGPDGSRVLAVLEPGDYGDRLEGPVQHRSDVAARLALQQRLGGGEVVMMVGVGDTGGASDLATLRHLEASVTSAEAPTVRHAAAEKVLDDLAALPGLPTTEGELLLNLHGSGCYTSKVGMKRWNAVGQRLARTAEVIALAATQAGLAPWPARELDLAWERLLWHQFHDDLTGTSTPAAYRFSWHDEALACSLFAGVITSRLAQLASQMDLRPVRGRPPATPFVVLNQVAQRRDDVVELVLDDHDHGVDWCAWDGQGRPLESQRLVREDGRIGILVRVRAPSLGLLVVWVGPGEPAVPTEAVLAEARALLGTNVQVHLDDAGDLGRITTGDGRELLRAPAGFELLRHRSPKFPAWEIHRETLAAAPFSRLDGHVAVRVLEPGPVRAALEIRRRIRGVDLRHTISIQAGSPVVRNRVQTRWHRHGAVLKASFPLRPQPRRVAFDGGLGSVERGPNDATLWEVPSQGWVAAEEGGSGVAIAAGDRYGWDQPSAGHLRLTLVHSPRTGLGRRFRHQATLDFGQWATGWSLWGYSGTWREGEVAARAEAETWPLHAFRTSPNDGGTLGTELSWLELPKEVGLLALGREPREQRAFLRVVERTGAPRRLAVASPLLAGPRELLDGCHRPLAAPIEAEGLGELGLRPFGCTTAAFGPTPRPDPIGTPASLPSTQAVEGLELDHDAIESLGVGFRLGRREGRPLALAGAYEWEVSSPTSIHVLVVGHGDRAELVIREGASERTVAVPDSDDFLAAPEQPSGLWRRGQPARIERTPVAGLAFRLGEDRRREPYRFATIFHLELAVEPGKGSLCGRRASVLAVSTASPAPVLEACDPLVPLDLGVAPSRL